MSVADSEPLAIRFAVGRKESPFGVVAWSPDGNSIAAAGGLDTDGDGVVWLWHLGNPEPLHLEGHLGAVTSIAWSPNGASIASGSGDTTVRLWDTATGHARYVLEGHSRRVQSVAWSPDGASVASGSFDGELRVWNAGSGLLRHRLKGHINPVLSVAWSPDGGSVASGSSDGTVWLWDVGNGRERQTLEGHKDQVRVVTWSPDGGSVASGSHDKTVRLWDPGTGRERQRLKGHSKEVCVVAWSPDGSSVASGSYDGTVRLWDAGSGRELHEMEGHSDWVQSVAWSPDGASVASGSVDGTVRLWDARIGRERFRLEGHASWVQSVMWSPDGESVASGSFDGTVRVWEAARGFEFYRLRGQVTGVASVAWSRDGRGLLSRSLDSTVWFWDTRSGRKRHQLNGGEGGFRSVAWSPDGASVVTGSSDGSVRLWDAVSGHERQQLKGHVTGVQTATWSPDGESVASGSTHGTVRLWTVGSGRERHQLEGHRKRVLGLAWSPDGASIASGSDDKTVRIWDAEVGTERYLFKGHIGAILSVAWSPDGGSLASGSDDSAVRLWDAKMGSQRFVLEGHSGAVLFLAWSRDSRILASADKAGALCIWDGNTGQLLDRRNRLYFWQSFAGIAFGAGAGVWENETLSVQVWRPKLADADEQMLQASAKVVFAGDSNAGKTCLARRLAEDRFEDNQSSTHGMQVWTLAPEKLHPDGAAPPGQRREVFLWDLGGQSEYQLVNQLFLHDTSVALVLFDASRGSVGLESANAWNQKLEASVHKILVRSKADKGGVVQGGEVEGFRERHGFRKYLEVSAASDGDAGVAGLREELHRAIDWDRVVLTSRPASFQKIRDFLGKARQAGTCVVYFDELTRGVAVPTGDIETTLGHLSREGQIVDLRLQSGDRVIVLRVDVLSRYASALVQAARLNDRKVPALEQHRILSAEMQFPGLAAEDRLPSRAQEKTVLEAAVRLMVERGICFDHQGLLIFPTLFGEYAPHEGALPPSAPIYYDFNGPIDNIYASLVARLAVSGKFGPVRLWAKYAAFGAASGDDFAVRRVDTVGRGHLDLYFDASTDPDLRTLFRGFVSDHLEREGVRVLSGMAFACRECGNEFSEEDVRFRLEKKFDQIQCQRCGLTYSLFAAADTATAESAKALVAFKTDVEERMWRSKQKVVSNLTPRVEAMPGEPLRILHLSDLHFTQATRVDSVLQPLIADLKEKLKIGRLDYLVVSGDFADRCEAKGFEVAGEFLQELSRRFEVTPLQTILVPGNHDLERREDHFTWTRWKQEGKYEDGFRQGDLVLVPSAKYVERFDLFRRFYHTFYSNKEYPQQAGRQFEVVRNAETGLRFLCLNSAWRVDEWRPERAELHFAALDAALLECGKVPLGILVWHHAAAGDRKIKDTKALQRLAEAGFHVLLHGDVHEDRDDVLGHLDEARKIHVVGGGAFGAQATDRPESTPRLYSVLEIARDLSEVRVIRRHQRSAEGPYDEYAVYPGKQGGKVGEYRIPVGAR